MTLISAYLSIGAVLGVITLIIVHANEDRLPRYAFDARAHLMMFVCVLLGWPAMAVYLLTGKKP